MLMINFAGTINKNENVGHDKLLTNNPKKQ
jgi:hypothetical protein